MAIDGNVPPLAPKLDTGDGRLVLDRAHELRTQTRRGYLSTSALRDLKPGL